MKKVLFMVMAAVAICFASCGGNKTAEAPADGVEAFDVQGAISNLQSQLESGDVSQFQKALEAVKEQIAKIDPEVAKEYISKVQNFLKENADKVKEMIGDNAVVSTLVTSIVDTPAESIISEVQSKLGEMGEAGKEAVEDAKEAGKEAVENVKEAGQEAIDNAKQAAEDKANEVVEDAKKSAAEGVDKAAEEVKKSLGL